MTTLLIIGFKHFGEININPSLVIVDEILQQGSPESSYDLETSILSVILGEAVSKTRQLKRELVPILCYLLVLLLDVKLST
jgi:pyrrolidone-carboxylate peptidase